LSLPLQVPCTPLAGLSDEGPILSHCLDEEREREEEGNKERKFGEW